MWGRRGKGGALCAPLLYNMSGVPPTIPKTPPGDARPPASSPSLRGPPSFARRRQEEKAPPKDGAKVTSGSWDRGYKLAPRTHVRRPTRPIWGGGVPFSQHCLKIDN